MSSERNRGLCRFGCGTMAHSGPCPPPPPPPPKLRVLSWDPAGQGFDESALIGLEVTLAGPAFITLCDRLPDGMEWPDQVQAVAELHEKVRPDVFVIDPGGCGAHAADEMFNLLGRPSYNSSLGLHRFVALLAHAGHKASMEGRSWHVPKQDLVHAGMVYVESERIKYSKDLPLGALLRSELGGFLKGSTPTGKPRFGNDVGPVDWRRSKRDDLVLALLGACYVASRWERRRPPGAAPGSITGPSKWGGSDPNYKPFSESGGSKWTPPPVEGW